MFIIPQDRPLVIEAQVNPINVNDVFVSQTAVLRVSSFDMRDTPDLIGSVTNVSPDSFTEPQTGAEYYRAEIELPQSELSKLRPDQVLIPGMPLDAFIRTGEHTPLAYMTEPIMKYFSRAMRDGT